MAEIRNRIYSLVFVKPTYIGAVENRKCSIPQAEDFHAQALEWRNLNFAISCHQVYSECSDIFFAQNGFEFFNARLALDFMTMIGDRYRAMITKIKYHDKGNRGDQFHKYVSRLFKECTGLSEIRVFSRFQQGTWAPLAFVWRSFLPAPRNPIELRVGKLQATEEGPQSWTYKFDPALQSGVYYEQLLQILYNGLEILER